MPYKKKELAKLVKNSKEIKKFTVPTGPGFNFKSGILTKKGKKIVPNQSMTWKTCREYYFAAVQKLSLDWWNTKRWDLYIKPRAVYNKSEALNQITRISKALSSIEKTLGIKEHKLYPVGFIITKSPYYSNYWGIKNNWRGTNFCWKVELDDAWRRHSPMLFLCIKIMRNADMASKYGGVTKRVRKTKFFKSVQRYGPDELIGSETLAEKLDKGVKTGQKIGLDHFCSKNLDKKIKKLRKSRNPRRA